MGTAGQADQHRTGGPADRLRLEPGQLVQELGWDEDCDDDLRAAIEDLTGNELIDDEAREVADVVLLWWRDGDGDLVDALVDATADLVDGGTVWLLTPKVGRDGHVDPADIADAAPTAGMATTTTLAIVEDWSATKLVSPRSGR